MTQAADTSASVARGPVWAAQAFLLSLAIPFQIQVGALMLMPHRVVLLVLFIPFFFKLFFMRGGGRVMAFDWLFLGSALWAGVALFANHGGVVIESAGIHIVEFFGAYLLARVAIRSARDFQKVAWTMFMLMAVLLPFAAIESLTGTNVLLRLLSFLPGSISEVNIGGRLGLKRAHTVFAHPILFGVFASAGVGIFWYALRPRGLRFIATPVAILCAFFSVSTGAFLSVLSQVIFIGWETILKTMRSRWRVFLGLSVLGYFLVDLVSERSPFHVLVHYATFSSRSAYNRILIWNFGTRNVAENPVFGLGFRDWERPPFMSDSVDNFWLLIAMRFGLPAIIMLGLAVFLIVRQVSRAELSNEEDKLTRSAFLVALGGVAIAGGTVHFWHAMMSFALFLFGAGVWAATNGHISAETNALEEDAREVPRRSRYTRQPAQGASIAAPGQALSAGRARPRYRAQLNRPL